MESLEEKIERLNLIHIDTCPEAIAQSYEMRLLKNVNNNFVYFKMYGHIRMMFTIEYLLSQSLEALLTKEKHNLETLVKG